MKLGFPCGSEVIPMVKNMPAMQETRVLSLGWEDSSGKGNGYPLQYSCLENSMDRGTWQAVTVSPWRCKELDMTERLMLSLFTLQYCDGFCHTSTRRTVYAELS